ncbi:MAG TPA: 2-succinyl-5-enolpyruvyl-6-hydroxy-3-cyclohexene-1-carboxylic-acid synthase [Actinomycetota bacterium]|nr:2-succinyl-5-enolpyruvyl-6-hydroxy-3-cyclohexene-1-carboxylic-acid synthase [Actinomycetota bacterium]
MRAENPGRAFSLALTDELVRNGVTHAVLSPGSRSAPLAFALSEHQAISLTVVLDERSAGFVALGIAAQKRRPVVVVTTSGSAAANLHPAVVESSHANIPLIIITADRPGELRDTGAGQTIDQIKLFGSFVRWFCEVGVPEDHAASNAYWRSVACRAVASTRSSSPGPVHLNVAFRDPLVPTGEGYLSDLSGRESGRPWITSTDDPPLLTDTGVEDLASALSGSERGLLVVGQGTANSASVMALSRALGWPVIAEAISGVRVPGTISTYDALLRVEEFVREHRPEVVLRLGSLGISKGLNEFLDHSVKQVMVDPYTAWRDPTRAAFMRVVADPTVLCDQLAKVVPPRTTSQWLAEWSEAERKARVAMDAAIDASSEVSEPLVARELAHQIPSGGKLLVASSMPVRDLDWFMQPRTDMTVFSNRGANGIDGFASTLLGLAIGSREHVYGLCGDLALMHDISGLIAAKTSDAEMTLVVINNDGGGIFSFLPQAEWTESFETIFGTPHGIEPKHIAEVAGFDHQRWDDPKSPMPLTGSPRMMIEVKTDRVRNVEVHRRIWESVAEALR